MSTKPKAASESNPTGSRQSGTIERSLRGVTEE
jgi:hypothetical protein